MAAYFHFADIFSIKLPIEITENTGMNEHTIKFLEKKQPSYRFIYTFSLVKLKTLNAYMKKTEFIQSFKSLASAFIFCNKKLNSIFSLYMNY